MSQILIVVLFFLGFLLILKAGDLLVESSVWLAEITRIPPMIIGATVVSIATTFPETTVAMLASFSGNEELAINTAVGSIICNFTLVLGIAFVFFPTKVDAKAFSHKSIFFLIVLVLVTVFSINGEIGLVEGIFLLILFFAFLVFNVGEAKKNRFEYEKNEDRPGIFIVLFQFVLSALAIAFGAAVLVNNVEGMSKIIGLSEEFVGLSLIALGTNLPEIVTTITSIKKRTPEIGIGNIFGASTINATLLVGISTIFSIGRTINLSKFIMFFSLPIMYLILFIISYPIMRKKRSTRLQGCLLILVYAVYSILMAMFV